MGKQGSKKAAPKPDSISAELTPEDWEEFERGVGFFNRGQFKHAKDAWQQVAERQPGGGGGFFQGLIQLATICQSRMTSKDGKSLKPAEVCAKLNPYQPEHLGVLVTPLLEGLLSGKEGALPRIQFRKPANPDLMVELCDMLHSPEFLEGVNLFNQGYHWEAHERWEEVYRGQEGEAKNLAEAFAQMASAFSFAKLGKTDSARYLLQKSIGTMKEHEHLECGVAFRELMAALELGLDQLANSQNGKKHSFNLPKITLG